MPEMLTVVLDVLGDAMNSTRSMASRVRLVRRAAGLTQAELAMQMKMSRSAVAQWESSTGSSPSADNLSRLAIKLGCSYEWLATGRGSRNANNRSAGHPAEDPSEVLRFFARTDAEEHLLATFRQLESWDQIVVGSLADMLATRPGSAARRVAKR